jgi:regulator of protease activity HflC (stomatin/prohibitin superfamily)
MKKILYVILVAVIATFSMTSCNERIDAGYEGILVKQYGSSKGVQNATLVTGRVWYNPLTEDVIEYPVFYQTADYEPFSVNAKDGSVFHVDPMLNYRVKVGKSLDIFVKYRKDVKELETTILLTYIKDVFKNVFNDYSTDDILSKRTEFDKKVTDILTKELEKEGFEIGPMTFGLSYPTSVTKAIEAKNNAIQRAQQKENELRIAKADAEIAVTKARGEAEANRIKQTTLTSLIIQQMFIEKWDGKSSLYGNSPAFMKNVQ